MIACRFSDSMEFVQENDTMPQQHCRATLSAKRAFLLSKAPCLPLRSLGDSYDEGQQLNIVVKRDRVVPFVSEDEFGWTESKTLQAPSDDDPDPEDEGCY